MGTRFFEKIITFLFDVLAINAAFAATFWLRYKSNLFPETYNSSLLFAEYLIPSLILCAAWISLFFFTGLYRDWYKESRLDEFFVVTRTVLFGVFILFILISADEIILFAKTDDLVSQLRIPGYFAGEFFSRFRSPDNYNIVYPDSFGE